MAMLDNNATFNRAIFERDGVVALRGVITPEEIAALRSDVDAQVQTLGTSATAYDLEAIAAQTWADDTATPQTGPATLQHGSHESSGYK
jgi:hypothetical protein